MIQFDYIIFLRWVETTNQFLHARYTLSFTQKQGASFDFKAADAFVDESGSERRKRFRGALDAVFAAAAKSEVFEAYSAQASPSSRAWSTVQPQPADVQAWHTWRSQAYGYEAWEAWRNQWGIVCVSPSIGHYLRGAQEWAKPLVLSRVVK